MKQIKRQKKAKRVFSLENVQKIFAFAENQVAEEKKRDKLSGRVVDPEHLIFRSGCADSDFQPGWFLETE